MKILAYVIMGLLLSSMAAAVTLENWLEFDSGNVDSVTDSTALSMSGGANFNNSIFRVGNASWSSGVANSSGAGHADFNPLMNLMENVNKTIAFWFYLDYADVQDIPCSGGSCFWLVSLAPSAANRVNYYPGSDYWNWTARTSANQVSFSGVSLRQWVHVAYTLDRSATQVILYVNGAQRDVGTYADVSATSSDGEGFSRDNSDMFGGLYIDDFRHYDGVMTTSEVEQLYFGYGGFVELLTPQNEEIVNEDPGFGFNITNYEHATWSDCELYDNRTGTWQANATLSGVSAGEAYYFNDTGLDDEGTIGNYVWNVHCSEGADELWAVQNYTLLFDSVDPIVTITSPSVANTTRVNRPLELDITIDDPNNFVAEVNITHVNGSRAYSEQFNTSGSPSFLIDSVVELNMSGNFTLLLEAADGHTRGEIPDVPYERGAQNELNFNEGDVRIRPANPGDFEAWTIERDLDRYRFGVERSASRGAGAYDEFVVSSHDEIEILSTEYAGHLIVKSGSIRDWYWIDFETAEGYEVTTQRVRGNEVRVRVYGGANADYEFNSLGKLNVVTREVSFYSNESSPFLNESYTLYVVEGSSTNFYLNVSNFDPVLYSPVTSASAYLEYEGVNYTSTVTAQSANLLSFRRSLTPSVGSSPTNTSHFWHVLVSDGAGGTRYLNTSVQEQSVYELLIGLCNATHPYPIVNYTYRDELTQNLINVTHQYNLYFYDGTLITYVNGTFENQSSDQFCTSLPPDTFVYNWEVYGDTILSANEYVTRLYSYPQANPYLVSNSPTLNLTYYLIRLDNSTTVQYTWYTDNYQLVDGIMRVYRCEPPAQRLLVEQTPIVGGSAVANLQLITQSYAYDVIIDGRVYQSETPGYSQCHVEYDQSVTYFVTTTTDIITPVIGLYFVDCAITDQGGNNVLMSWEDNAESSAALQACVVGFRDGVYGKTETFRQCTNTTSGSQTVFITAGTNTEYVLGELTQGGVVAYCQNPIVYGGNENAGQQFGALGLFGVALFVLGMILIYSGNGELQVIVGALSVLFAWAFGLLSIGWIGASAIALFGFFVVGIGRYARSRS